MSANKEKRRGGRTELFEGDIRVDPWADPRIGVAEQQREGRSGGWRVRQCSASVSAQTLQASFSLQMK